MHDKLKLLAIETTGPLASAAVLSCGHIYCKVNETNYSHLEEIAPMTLDILEKSGEAPQSLDAVAVSSGPGSFTGIRIGMATAKALAQVWDKPVIAIPTLASFAFSDLEWTGLPENRVLVCPVFDARRSQIYAGAYVPQSLEPVLEDGAYDIPAYAQKLACLAGAGTQQEGKTAVFFGDGCDVYEQALRDMGIPCLFAPKHIRYQSASDGVKLAARLWELGRKGDAYGVRPEYLRAAEAERKLKEKAAAEKTSGAEGELATGPAAEGKRI